jgi:hypothetical protein
MSLARRIDYESARAIEWRAGELRPLPDAERVEVELGAHFHAAAPAGPVIERARRLLRSPGDRAVGWLAVAVSLLCVFAAVAGMQVARMALGDPADGPVNVVWFLGHALGLQTFLLLVTVFVTVADRSALGRILGHTLSLGAMALSAAVRLASPKRPDGETGGGAAVVDRLRGLRELRPLALAASHGAWTSFNLALLAAAALILSAEHHAFAWQSTFVQDAARAERALHALTLPSRIWPGAPTTEQVRISRFDPEAGDYLDHGGHPDRALALRQGWSTQLLASVAGWGLLPRLLLLGASWLSWRSRREGLLPEAGDPYLEAVLARLSPALTTDSEEVSQDPLPEPAAGAAQPGDATQPLRAHAGAWLGTAPQENPVVALLGRRDSSWRSLPRLDSRAGEAAALQAIERPALLVLLCDWSVTPDASLGRFLAEAAAARSVLVLTGGSAFRATRRGATPEGVRARRAAWTTAAARWGVAEDDVVDFDADSVTAGARAALLAHLGEGGDRPGGGDAAFREALDRVAIAAARWERELPALAPDALEAAQLRAAARVRGEVESCFAELPPPAAAGAAVVGAARAVLGDAISGASDAAWETAIGEAARWGRLLAKVKDVDPRWSAAGLAVGLLAGPLGGAVAAGSAGLIAGASLTSTLAPLGAALGSALSLRKTGAAAPEESAAPRDLLGLPARTGVLRSLELQLQGRGEEAISRALGELGRAPDGESGLDTAEDVRRLCERAREIGGGA